MFPDRWTLVVTARPLVASLQSDPAKLKQLRAEFDTLAADIFEENTIRMPFLMTRATKV